MPRVVVLAVALSNALFALGGCASSLDESQVLSDTRVYREHPIAAQCTSKDRLGVTTSGPCAVGKRRVPIDGEVVYMRGGACFRTQHVPNESDPSLTEVVHAQVPCPAAR